MDSLTRLTEFEIRFYYLRPISVLGLPLLMHKRKPPKPIPFFDRAVPVSSRYAHVKATLDTGNTVAKVKTVGAKEISRRRDETFFRIGRVQLAQLFDEYEAEEESFQATYSPEAGPTIITYDEEATPKWERPYLLLDVRDPYEFSKGHLYQARSYPFVMMRRDQVIPEVFNFKNKEGCLIVMYCEDERTSAEAAHLLVQRGWDNVYLLTGGVKEFAAHFPHLIEGEVPTSPLKSPSSTPPNSKSGIMI